LVCQFLNGKKNNPAISTKKQLYGRLLQALKNSFMADSHLMKNHKSSQKCVFQQNNELFQKLPAPAKKFKKKLKKFDFFVDFATVPTVE
jgi:hypothetical protein